MIEGTGTNGVPEEIAVKMSENLTGKEAERGQGPVRTAFFSHISRGVTKKRWCQANCRGQTLCRVDTNKK